MNHSRNSPKVQKIIVLFKYTQDYKRMLKAQNQANKIQGAQKARGLDVARALQINI
jgi:hypothetical protein